MRLAVNGVTYRVEIQGRGPTVLLLHGFTGSVETWTPHLEPLEAFTVLRIDFLGHGGSDAPIDARRYGMEACIDDVLSLLDGLNMHRFAVLGYSMGGRVAMRIALRAPERIWAVVLESTSPGIVNAAERRSRARQDSMLAQRIRKDGVPAFVDHWQSIPLFASQTRLPEEKRRALRSQRLQHTPEGLANSLEGLSAGRQDSVLHALRNLHLPVLLLAGELDDKYCRLAHEMSGILPCHRLTILPGAGHAVHLEQPVAFDEAVAGFLRANAPAASRLSS